MPEQYLYLFVNLFAISYPLAQSFEWRLKLYQNWKALFPAIAGMALFFISWDMLFTSWGVWGFNPRYLSGIELGNLPLGEWLFFLTVPYACVFIYEVLNYFVPKDIFGSVARPIGLGLAVVLLVIGLLTTDQLYTSVTFILTSALLFFVVLIVKPKWLGRFFLAYLVVQIPFTLVNGVLTGSWIPEQIVWYNDAENFGFRLGTIPVEDTVYNMLMLLLTITIYEKLLKRNWGNWEQKVAQRKEDKALSKGKPVTA